MRHCTGLRNRHRNGRGTYSRNRKGRNRDRYGKFDNGTRLTPDNLVKWVEPAKGAAA